MTSKHPQLKIEIVGQELEICILWTLIEQVAHSDDFFDVEKYNLDKWSS
jgi:hypothetical protein